MEGICFVTRGKGKKKPENIVRLTTLTYTLFDLFIDRSETDLVIAKLLFSYFVILCPGVLGFVSSKFKLY